LEGIKPRDKAVITKVAGEKGGVKKSLMIILE
jgi:hypothetical protein